MLVEEEPQVIATSHYTVRKTAELLGISVRTIQRKIKSRDIKTIVKVIDNKKYITGLEILKLWNKTY